MRGVYPSTENFRVEAYFTDEGRIANVSAFYGSEPDKERDAMAIDVNDAGGDVIVDAMRTLMRFYLGEWDHRYVPKESGSST